MFTIPLPPVVGLLRLFHHHAPIVFFGYAAWLYPFLYVEQVSSINVIFLELATLCDRLKYAFVLDVILVVRLQFRCYAIERTPERILGGRVQHLGLRAGKENKSVHIYTQ